MLGPLLLLLPLVSAQYPEVGPPGALPPQEPNSTSTRPSDLRPPPVPQWIKDDHGSGELETILEEDQLTVASSTSSQSPGNRKTCPTDVVFVLDATNSVKGVFKQNLDYIAKVIEMMEINDGNDRVGVIVYSSSRKQKEKIKLGAINKSVKLISAVKDLPFFSGITATGAALKFAATVAAVSRRKNEQLIFVVLTDGFSYDSVDHGANKLTNIPNTKVFTVTLGDIFLRSDLDKIASTPENVFIGSGAVEELVRKMKTCSSEKQSAAQGGSTSDKLAKHLRDEGDLQSTTPNYKDAVGHSNDLSSDQLDRLVSPPEGSGGDCKVDLVLLIDASGSLVHNFDLQLKYANELIDQLHVSSDATRVALIKFAGKTKSRVLNDLSENVNKRDLKKLVSQTRFLSGTTYTNEAIELAVNLFQRSSRKDAKRFVVVFSDGYSAQDTNEGVTHLNDLHATVFAVGIASNDTEVNKKGLEVIAGDSKRVFSAANFDRLLGTFRPFAHCA